MGGECCASLCVEDGGLRKMAEHMIGDAKKAQEVGITARNLAGAAKAQSLKVLSVAELEPLLRAEP
jgi:hypothetical protein